MPEFASKNEPLLEKQVVVIGGSSGIGLAVAQQAIAQGAEVVIASSNPERVKQVASALGPRAKGHVLNVSDEKQIEKFFAAIGEFDHLVFTAGDSLQLTELATMDLKQARHAFELRYWGALAAAKYASRHIRRGGSIVLTTGIAGDRPQKGWTLGASVCGAMSALTRALAMELAPVRVNAVSPGIVRTNLWQTMTEQQRESLFESVGKSLPVARVGEADDIARTYLYLMQEGFSTGQVITVDGGAVLV
jgi:NAD(P)-dependent dehydrogenase (short-subunit alcohol dehydrogenase family)